MFTDSFTQIEHGDAAKILDLLNPLLDGAPFDAVMIRIISHDLPFYDGYSLVEVSDYDVNPPRQVSFIQKEDEILILNGTNEPIYKLNEKLPILLNEDIVKTYIRFFFHYVRGRHGKFQITENIDDVDWREEPAPAGRKALSKMIQPLEMVSANAEEYQLRGSIIFKDSLFQSDIQVKKDGNVSLTNQELLVEDIPVVDENFDQ